MTLASDGPPMPRLGGGNVRSKGRCGSASAVRPAAFHASGPVGAEWSWRKRQPGRVRSKGEKAYFVSTLLGAGKRYSRLGTNFVKLGPPARVERITAWVWRGAYLVSAGKRFWLPRGGWLPLRWAHPPSYSEDSSRWSADAPCPLLLARCRASRAS